MAIICYCYCENNNKIILCAIIFDVYEMLRKECLKNKTKKH